MRTTTLRAILPLALLAALPISAATAAAPAGSTVTITAEGTDLSGTVSSSASCKDDRKVVVFKQRGTKGGGDDRRIATDDTEVSGGVGRWSTGNTGMTGRFYAKVTKTADCSADVSPTIRVTTSRLRDVRS
ncbi:hypothetical protein HNR19_000374 [Nocardioides thalensis]|uniref:Uncharacterized protein n=1 Tax=Nocardioides thalensis TaxID=1914755 RepID=A0A853BY38_9ACTN|nr:hypothetical protein [Nocardioides thalensis]NYI99675.1 hypothetical protein [Nocardioides thalensis]